MRNILLRSIFYLFCDSLCYAYYDNFNTMLIRRNDEDKFLNETWFGNLQNYQTNAVPVSEVEYPWIARVIHSRTLRFPHVCTAVCIDKRIFITSSRCLFNLKLVFTRIIYQYQPLTAIAFVQPSEQTKMLYDDIGFIVVNDKGFRKPWYTVQLFDTTNRTDSRFEWFDRLNPTFNSSKFKVVGYSMKKEFKDIREADTQFDLSELQVDVDINLCSTILTGNNKFKGFHVPCYYSCTLWQFRAKNIKCKNFHGVDGGALINMWDNKLLGIATWGINSPGYNLPVGFSVPNSLSFFEDYECSRRIRDTNVEKIVKGHYQGICDHR